MVKEEVLGGKDLSSSAWHKLEAPGKMDCQLRNCLYQIGQWVSDPRTILGQVVLGCNRRQAKRAMSQSRSAQLLPGSCDPEPVSQTSLFLPQVGFGQYLSQ